MTTIVDHAPFAETLWRAMSMIPIMGLGWAEAAKASDRHLAATDAIRASVTVGAPAFGRDSRNVSLWRTPRTAEFHFRLQQGRLVEVTEPTE